MHMNTGFTAPARDSGPTSWRPRPGHRTGEETPAARVRILLVEDHPPDVRFFCEALDHAGFPNELATVSDGEEALRFLRREGVHASAFRPHVVVLDLKLPRLSGFAVLGVIRLETSLRDIPVVILTSTKAQRDRDHVKELRADYFITKPVGVELLAEELRVIEHIARGRAGRTRMEDGRPVADRHVYTISPMTDGRWLVESTTGSACYFQSRIDAEDFALALASEFRPSVIRMLKPNGHIAEETYYDPEPGKD
jgi:chemotaxis family two-component system response regulator Rcp1